MSIFGLQLVKASIVYGVSSASGIGFCWVGSIAAETYLDLEFATMMGEIGRQLCENRSGKSDKACGLLLYCVFHIQWKHHIRDRISTLRRAYKYALASGDKIFVNFSQVWCAMDKYYIGDHLSETLKETQVAFEDANGWSENTISALLLKGNERVILALQGKTKIADVDTILDDEFFNEKEYIVSSFLQVRRGLFLSRTLFFLRPLVPISFNRIFHRTRSLKLV